MATLLVGLCSCLVERDGPEHGKVRPLHVQGEEVHRRVSQGCQHGVQRVAPDADRGRPVAALRPWSGARKEEMDFIKQVIQCTLLFCSILAAPRVEVAWEYLPVDNNAAPATRRVEPDEPGLAGGGEAALHQPRPATGGPQLGEGGRVGLHQQARPLFFGGGRKEVDRVSQKSQNEKVTLLTLFHGSGSNKLVFPKHSVCTYLPTSA